MSLTSEADGNDKDFPKLELNCGNYLVWREKAEDYIRGQPHHAADTMIEAAWWVATPDDEGDVPPDPADAFLALPTNNEMQRQFKVVHQRVFAFLRRKLCDGLFQKTMTMKVKTVPALLRLLRDTWNDGSAIDRGRLRDEMAACRPEQHASFTEYVTALDQMFATMKSAGINTYDDDEDKLYRLITSLDDTWKIHKSTATATELTYTEAKAFFQKCAKSDPNISGTSVVASGKSTKNRRSEIFTAQEQRQPCWKFAKGTCHRGDNCKFLHGNTNSGSCGPSSGHEKQNGAGGGQPSQRKCATCKAVIKGGPKHWKKCGACFKKAKEQGASQSGQQHSANVLTQVSEAGDAGSASQVTDGATKALNPEILGGYCFAAEASPYFVSVDPAHAAHTMQQARDGTGPPSGAILVAMDSAATCGVVESEEFCVDVKSVNTTVKVGGDGKPHFVQVRKQGVLPIDQFIDGRRVALRLDVFIIPGFGISIFPLSFLLKRKIDVAFKGTTMTATGPDGHIKMQARALHHDRESWLFYAHLRVDGAHVPLLDVEPPSVLAATSGCESMAKSQQNTGGKAGAGACAAEAASSAAQGGASMSKEALAQHGSPVPVSYAFHVSEGEIERQRLCALPEYELDEAKAVVRDEAGQVLAVTARDPKALALLFHKRFGHRNYRDCADELGIQLPADMPSCITCKLSKSKRTTLTGGDQPLFEAPRAAHTWMWDHAGPFHVQDWEGNSLFSLKVCVHSGKIIARMVKSTGTSTREWMEFVRRLNAHFGRPTVARLVTDGAPYFATYEMEIFNSAQGIVHTQLPPHTQELNGVVERLLGVIFSMARAAMLEACTPERSYGLCLVMMADTLNTLRHRRGGRLSRNEKWLGRLLPNQHKNLGVWGCAAILHTNHHGRGHVGGPGGLPKLDPPGEMCVLVGYGEHCKRVLRIKYLPKIVLYTSAHVTLIENVFPFKAKPERPIGEFLTAEQLQLLEVQEDYDAGAIAPSRGRGRPAGDSRSQRLRTPSTQALRNLPDVDAPPDFFAEAEAHFNKLEQERGVIDHFKAQLNFSTWCDLRRDLQRKINQVYAEVWATVGSGEDERNYFKLITESPHKSAWLSALAKEWQSHQDLKTMSEPIQAKDLPPGARPIPFDLIGKVKRDGTYKCRGIVKGFHMREGIDFNETFATVPCLTSLRYFLAHAAQHDWDVWQGDVSTAFLAAKMDTDLYMAVPNWFCKQPNGSEVGFTIRKALKAIPGVPQGPRLWGKTSKAIFEEADLRHSKAESCLYFCSKRSIYIIVWVDDIFLFAPILARPEVDKLWKFLQGKMILGDKEPIADCLGVSITRDRANKKMWLSQQAAVDKLIKRAQLTEAKTADTPMVAGIKLTKQDCPSSEAAAVMVDKQKHYRSVIASAIYITMWTRPDIAYAVSKLCRFMHNPGEEHIKALKRLLRYMAGTSDYGLRYDFSEGWQSRAHPKCKEAIYGFYDAAHADCIDTYKSTGAYCFYLSGCIISWHTKLLPTITTSTNHSEYCTGAKAAKEARWLHNFAGELNMNQLIKPIDVYSDSQGAIAMTYNPVNRSTTKHIALADHYVREQQEEGVISVSYVDTQSMIADIFTKPLGDTAFLRHRRHLVTKGGV